MNIPNILIDSRYPVGYIAIRRRENTPDWPSGGDNDGHSNGGKWTVPLLQVIADAGGELPLKESIKRVGDFFPELTEEDKRRRLPAVCRGLTGSGGRLLVTSDW